MKVLGIETASLVCGAAVASEGRVAAEAWIELRNVHAERLMSLIDRALGESGTEPGALDGIAVSAGPGSFTGLRVGVSVAKGLAYALGKPLAAVPTLTALAERAVRESVRPMQETVVPLLDARRDEMYYQMFHVDGDSATPLAEPRVDRVAEICALLAGRSVLLTGEAAGKLMEKGAMGEGAVRAVVEISRCSAGMIALLGTTMVRSGNTVDPMDLEPRYIKDFFLKIPHA